MKKFNIISIVLLMVSSLAIAGQPDVGSRFSYQGQLQDNGTPANGLYDMRFEIFSGLTGGADLGTLDVDDVEVSNGLFNTELDFGDAIFNGDELYLEISIENLGSPGYSVLTPRQRINTVPYAIQAEFVKNGSTQWEDITGGIGYTDDVKIGNTATATSSMLTVDVDANQSPVRFKIGGVTKMIIRPNGGTSIGGNITAPVNGLYVDGNANQALTSHGFVKAGVVIQCAAGFNGGAIREFNNVNNNDFTTAQNGAGGFCAITVPFDIDQGFYTVSAHTAGGVLAFQSSNASCSLGNANNVLRCQINRVSSTGVTNTNGVLQILFY